MKEWFEGWFDTKYYKALYSDRDEKEADHFIDLLMSKLKLPRKAKILDVGCGLGRHSIALNEIGFDVTGIDLSFVKISDNLLNANDNLHFYRHDMRHLFRINYFDCVFNFFTSFGYFNSLQEEKNTAVGMAANLKWGGVFVIDYFNAEYLRKHLISSEEINKNGYHFKIERSMELQRISKKITVIEADKCTVFYEKVRMYSLGQMKALFSQFHLKLEQVFGSYLLDEYDVNKSERMILVFRKADKE